MRNFYLHRIFTGINFHNLGKYTLDFYTPV
jgi:hypothetical protein